MDKIEKDARVEAVRSYLQVVGCTLSNTQVHEVVARAAGLKNKHVLAAKIAASRNQPKKPQAPTLPAEHLGSKVFTLNSQPFSVAQMQELKWAFDAIVPVPLEYLGDIQRFNDHVSCVITGNDAALEDIQFEHVSEITYGKGFVAQRVKGYVSAPEDFFDEVIADADVHFYADLQDLAGKLWSNTTATLVVGDKQLVCDIRGTNKRALDVCARYAVSQGGNNDEVNQLAKEIVVVFVSQDSEQHAPVNLVLGDLKYAVKLNDTTWSFSIDQCVYQLQI